MIYLLYGWILLGGLIGGIIQLLINFPEDMSYSDAFWFAMQFYDHYEKI